MLIENERMLFAEGHPFSHLPGPIGIFDSGYGGLTVFDKIRERMPHYDYIYLGDNARTPYGARSFEVVYQFTRQAVFDLFRRGCLLVILACNTASAKALRTIQQRDLPVWDPSRRVLGVIRPTVELMDQMSRTKHVGVLGTSGTISSRSYEIEIAKMFPHIQVTGEACPMWVPLVENGEAGLPGSDYFVERHLQHILSVDPQIDTLILGCTHYPLLRSRIIEYFGEKVHIVNPAYETAMDLKSILEKKGIANQSGKPAVYDFYVSDAAEKFTQFANTILPYDVAATKQINIEEY